MYVHVFQFIVIKHGSMTWSLFFFLFREWVDVNGFIWIFQQPADDRSMSSISMKRDKIGGRAWVLHGYKWLLSSHLITASLQIEKNESNQIKLLYYCCLIIVSLRCGCINTIGIMGSESMLTHFCHYWSRHFSTGYASKVKTFSSTWDGIKFDHYPSPDWNFGNFMIRFWVKPYKPWYFKGWTTPASSTALVLNCACHTRHVNIKQVVAADCGEWSKPYQVNLLNIDMVAPHIP